MKAQRFDQLRTLESELWAPLDPGQRRDLIEVALQCAQGRRLGHTGDPQPILLLVARTIDGLPKESRDDTLRLRAAAELVQIDLYRRALEVTDSIPDERLSPAQRTTRAALRRVLTLTPLRLDGLDRGERQASMNDPIGQRLLDLLALAPGYLQDELAAAWLALGTESEAPAIRALEKAADELATESWEESTPFAGKPALTYLFRRESSAQPPAEAGGGALAWEDQESDPSLLELASDDGQPLEILPFNDQQLRHLAVLQATVAKHPADAESAVLTALPVLLPAAPEAETSVEIFTSGAGLSYADPEKGATLVFLPFDPGEAVQRWQAEESFETRTRFLDVTADGDPEIVNQSVGGTGGFLSVDVSRRSDGRTLLAFLNAAKGNVTFANLDADPELEAIVTGGTVDQLVPFGQYPRRFQGALYDYQPEAQRYRRATIWATVAEWLGGTSAGPWGLTASMFLHGLEDDEEGARNQLARLDHQSPSTWTEQQLQSLLQAVRQETNLHVQEQDTWGALRLLDQTAAVLRRAGNRPDVRSHLVRLEFLRAWSLYSGNEPEAARRVLREPWVEAAARREPDLQRQHADLLGAASLASERFDEAFDQLHLLDQTVKPREGSIDANLAHYYSLVGDSAAARERALAALDFASAHPDRGGMSFALTHLASIAARLGEGREALDWAFRALLAHKGSANHDQAVGVLLQAASAAIENHLPRVALGLLDEALLFGEPLGWRINGGSLLLLYATALEALHQDGPAQATLHAAALNAERTSTAVAANAYFQLSQHAVRAKDEPKALAAAKSAFALLISGRRRIGVEEHKFSFLTDKQEIADWLFDLLLRRGSPPEELLETLEAWKMQTFLDIYRTEPQATETSTLPQNLANRLTGALARDDLFLDLSLGTRSPFAIVLRGAGAPAAVRLSCGREEIRRQAARVRKAFDLGDAASIANIRDDRPSEGLEQALSELGRCVFGGLGLGSETRRVLIASDDLLFGIPWAAVRDDKGPLLDRFEIQQVPSAWVALRPRGTASRRDGPALLVGALGEVAAADLDLALGGNVGRSRARRLPPLRNGWQECLRVGRAFQPRPLWLLLDAESRRQNGPAHTGTASPEGLLALLPRASLAHIVAHGVYNPFAPMRSALFLDSGRRGRLVLAQDLARLDLSGLQLATLSACQTGVSGAQPGSEPLGFLRALLGAGAETVLLADWSVDDRTTADLMRDFYAGLRHERRSAALRHAQLAQRARHRHPFYWAGFSLHGGWSH